MGKKRVMTLLVSLVLTGCVSSSDHNRLKNNLAGYKREIKLYEQQLYDKREELISEVRSFKNSYSPELHQLLNNNIEASESYYKKVVEIQKNMQILELKMNKLLKGAEKNLEVIKSNAQMSSTENVVNEFATLKKDWEKTISSLVSRSKEVEELAEESKDSVDDANKLVIKAQTIALTASEETKKITVFQKDLAELQAFTKFMKLSLNEIKKDDSPNQKDVDMLFELYKSINSRLAKIEAK